MACASSLASSLAAVRSLARARGAPSSPRLVRVAARRRLARARAPRVAAPRFRPVRPDDVAARRRFLDARVSRASPARRLTASDAPGGDASDRRLRGRPARRVRRAPPRRGGRTRHRFGPGRQWRNRFAATDPPRDDETDDESDAAQAFEMREALRRRLRLRRRGRGRRGAARAHRDAALARAMSSCSRSASDASDVRGCPPLARSCSHGDPPGHNCSHHHRPPKRGQGRSEPARGHEALDRDVQAADDAARIRIVSERSHDGLPVYPGRQRGAQQAATSSRSSIRPRRDGERRRDARDRRREQGRARGLRGLRWPPLKNPGLRRIGRRSR